jgi:uncharacterized cupredoxin-like copper-binding protein
VTATKEESEMRTLTIRSAPAFAVVSIAFLAASPLLARGAERQSATRIDVKGGEFFFRLSSNSFAKPGRVTFVFKNVGHVVHNFAIDDKATPLIQPGKTTRLVVIVSRKGRYSFSCTVPGHASAGMRGVFTVR